MGEPRLEIDALSKTFGPAKVLRDVELTVEAGEVHGLAGQNGSGKSTLIKILTGVYSPDPGAHYRVDGVGMRLPVRWREVHAAGVSVVHQDLGLLDQLSVAENVCVGGFPTARIGRIDRRERDRLADKTLARLGVDLDPTRLVGTLSAAQRAEVAIARAMRDLDEGSGLVILDESTRALSGTDLKRIHALLARIAASGSAALMISHNLTELMAVTDRLTVLRDGRLVGAGLDTRHLSEQEIARRMIGSTVEALTRRQAVSTIAPKPKLRVTNLSGSRVSAIDFAVAPGEVLGITGLPGSGYEEIPYLLSGAQRATSGFVDIGSTQLDLAGAGVAACIRAGIVLVPERRDRDGLAFDLSVRDNLSLPALRVRGRPWYVARRWQRESAARATATLDIKPPDSSLLVKQLSGGNQQKVLLAKWLNVGPTVLVLHEPTQAVDVGARRDILTALHRAADSGVAVLLVSSEPEDLAAACDRVLVYSAGVGLAPVDCTTPDVILEQTYAAAGSPT